MVNNEKTFTDLVNAIQTIAYGEGKYMQEDSRTALESISIGVFNVSEQAERIANSLETLVELYEWNLPKKDPKKYSIYQQHPGTDMTGRVQAVLDKIRSRQSE